MDPLVGTLQQAKLVLLGDMGAGKSSLVLRFVKGQFFDYQVWQQGTTWPLHTALGQLCIHQQVLKKQCTICLCWI